MYKFTRSGALVIAMLLVGACGPPRDRVLDIKAELPSGVYNGQPWQMTKATVSRETDRLEFKVFAENVADCAAFSPAGSTVPYMLWSMPAQVGRRELQLSLSDLMDPDNQTVTMVTPPSSNDISVDGIFNITELTSTSITIGMLIEWGTNDVVNGTITTTLCP